MNKGLLYLLVKTSVLLAFSNAKAQNNSRLPDVNELKTTVQSLTVENGLPQGYVNGIVQDSTGFIWLSTRDGLARYDGYRVKTFHYDPVDSSTIASDVIQTIYLDGENQIWILYENFAVDVFNPVTEEVRHVRANGPLGWLLKDRKYSPFILQQDSHGKYWYVSPGLRQIRHFTRLQPEPVLIPNPGEERILAMEEGRDGEMYVCTDHSFYTIRGDRLHKIADLPHRRRIRNDRISQMVQDVHGNWVIMNSGYIVIFKPDREWRVVDVSYASYPGSNYFVDRSSGGDIYFNSGNRVFRLNADHSLTLVWTNTNRSANIPSMMIDRSNVLWLGTNTFGARSINLSLSGFYSYPYEYGFTNDVLTRWFRVPYNPENHRQGVDSYQLRYARDMNGSCWMLGTEFISPGSAPGNLRLQPHLLTGGKYIPASFRSDSFYWLQFAFDNHHNCWGVVLNRDGDTVLVKAGLLTGVITQVQFWKGVFSEIGYLAAFQDKLCIVYNEGIELFDPASRKSVIYSSKEVFGNVKLLMAVPDVKEPGVLWITSLGYGLIKFNAESGRMEAFTVKDGIPSNSVYTAVFDESGNLWCSSNKGIFRFNPGSHEVLSFVSGDGLQGNEFNRYHFLESSRGHIFFGGTRGWTVFHPDSIHVDTYQPATAITGILVNNTPLTLLREWKDSAVTALHALSLNYDQNFVTFNFAGLQFSNTGKLTYRYRLKGFDENWVEVGNQHTANYTNLPAGDYIFEVNSSNAAGIWSSFTKTLPLIIHPPWWKTWWAYILYASMIIGCGYMLYRYRINRLRVRRQMTLQQEEAKRLRVMDEMKMRFFSNITHEFRTPLSLIIAPLEQISREMETPPSVRKKINRIQNNAHQLLGLINQLLDMSKMEAGNMGIFLSRGNLGLFIADHVRGFEQQALLKNIRLDFDNKLPGEYDFDADKWQKILFNLLSNAIKFTPGGGLIKVSLSAYYDNGLSKAVELRVMDQGIGIPADKLAFIFNRFYQVDDSGTRSHGGTGIGLALVKELIELMNGTIEAESSPGNGTLFRVLIPVEKASGKDTLPLDRTLMNIRHDPDVDLPGGNAGKKERKMVAGREAAQILLVEDNEDLNCFVAHTLEKSYRVMTAFNGREALRLATENLPDLIISDIMMPEMDGYALCEKLKGSVATDHIAFILLSAKASHDSVLKGLENHADDYITKPFHVDELLLRIHNLIERQRKLQHYYNRQLTAPGEQFDSKTIPNQFLRKLYAIIEEYLDDTQLDVGKLAKEMAVSRRTLNRKLSMLVNLSANEVIRQYRLKKAVTLLQSGFNVSETAYRVGFASDSYFSKSFKDFYGAAPSVHVNETFK